MRLLPARTKREMLEGVAGVTKSKIIRHSTVLYETEEATVLRYHFTDIVTAYKDGRVVLANGGYYTINTKSRLNEDLRKYGLSIESDGTDWWVKTRTGARHLFHDGITFKDWMLYSEEEEPDDRRDLKRKILAYAKTLRDMKSAPEPEGGDCWLCQFKNEDTEHLRSHVEERYIHGTLICNAMEHCGYNPQYRALHDTKMMARCVKNYLSDKLNFPR